MLPTVSDQMACIRKDNDIAKLKTQKEDLESQLREARLTSKHMYCYSEFGLVCRPPEGAEGP